MEINRSNNAIAVHGREALNLPYSRWSGDDDDRVQVDISGSTMFIEIPAAGIREQLVLDDADAKSLRIYLTRSQVESLPIVPTPFIVIDETVADIPELEWEGMIFRRGYKGAPTPPPTPVS